MLRMLVLLLLIPSRMFLTLPHLRLLRLRSTPSLTETGTVTKSYPKRSALLYAACRTPLQAQAQGQVRRLSQPPSFSTSSTRSSPRTWTWTWTAATLLAVSGASGIIGYELASQRKTIDDTATISKSRFGSKEDLQKAIHELKSIFPGGAASTDPHDLAVHGISLNDYHPGAFSGFRLRGFDTHLSYSAKFSQMLFTTSSYTPNLQKMSSRSSTLPRSIKFLSCPMQVQQV